MSKKPTIKDLEQKIGELTEALQRERADAMNVRRRTEEEKAQLGNFYKSLVIRELLPALDNLDRALKHAPKELKDSDYVKGIQGVEKQFEDCFAKLGVERIKTVGEPFDPKLHEAISVEEPSFASDFAKATSDIKATEGGNDQEVVSEELQPGYKIDDEIIRHALVKVKMQANGSERSSTKPEGEGEEKK